MYNKYLKSFVCSMIYKPMNWVIIMKYLIKMNTIKHQVQIFFRVDMVCSVIKKKSYSGVCLSQNYQCGGCITKLTEWNLIDNMKRRQGCAKMKQVGKEK